MPDYDLGTARGTIELTFKKDGIDDADKSLGSAKKSAEGVGDAFDRTAKSSGAAGVLLAGGLAVAGKSAADFEKQLSAIKAVSGETPANMEKLRVAAMRIGKDTSFSASEAALAIEELAKAGVSTADILNGAADATVALAAAGGVELPEAATIASNAMNAFNIDASKMPEIADSIAGAANASAIGVSDFGQSLSQVGAVANLAGLSFDDTATAIAELGNAGIKGSDAGTSLKTFLMNLQPTTDKAADAMKKLGIITSDGTNQFFNAKGELKSFGEVQDVLSKSLEGMTKAQKQATLQTLFGSDAVRAASVFADEGAKGFDKLNDSMHKVSAADVAAKRMDNLAGDIEQLKGSAETFAIQLGTILLPSLRSLAEGATNLLNKFMALSPETQKLILQIVGLSAGFLLATAGIIKTVRGVTAAVKTVKTIGTAFKALKGITGVVKGFKALAGAIRLTSVVMMSSPIFWIIAALVGLGIALVALYKKNETFRNFVNAAWAKIRAAIGAVVNWLVGTAWPFIQMIWQQIVIGAQWLWQQIVTIWNAIKNAISTAISFVRTVIVTAMAVLTAIWQGAWAVIRTVVSTVWNTIKSIVTGAINGVRSIISSVLNTIRSIMSSVWNAIKSIVTKVWNALRSAASSVWNAIKSVISTAINGAKAIVSTAVSNIKSIVSSGFNAAKSLATTAFNGMKNAISIAINGAKTVVSTAISDIKGFFSGAGTWLYDAGKRVVQGLINGIKNMAGAVGSAISGVAGKVKGFFFGSPIEEGPLKDAGWNDDEPGKKLSKSLATGIEDGRTDVAAAAARLAQFVPSVFTDVGLTPTQQVTSIAKLPSGASMSDALSSIARTIGDVARNTAPGLKPVRLVLADGRELDAYLDEVVDKSNKKTARSIYAGVK